MNALLGSFDGNNATPVMVTGTGFHALWQLKKSNSGSIPLDSEKQRGTRN